MRTRTLVIGPYPPYRMRAVASDENAVVNARPAHVRLDEAVGLANAIDLDVIAAEALTIAKPRPSTLIGKGRVEEFALRVSEQKIGLVVVDGALTPVQQRNLERAWGTKVIDRTGLILEIFGRRARTKEGRLQVELAHLDYQKSRLVRSWTHLERQRGGFGFLGGPGETQIEADRRVIQDRIRRIERDLETVRQTRELHRVSRRRVPYPIVALVGYTNAGKSTLFNRLTSSQVMAADLLFATLDPTARAIRLPHGEQAILSDTVGFISDLPTMLVASFRATLEDVVEADLLLHVRDMSHEESEAEAEDVAAVLRQLGLDPDDRSRLVEVWNKADLLPKPERDALAQRASLRSPSDAPALVSALTGEGMPRLLRLVEDKLSSGRPIFRVRVSASDGGGLHWLYEESEVIGREDTPSGAMDLVVRLAREKEPRLLQRFPDAVNADE